MEILLAYIGVALMVGVSGTASAFGITMTANATIGAIKKDMSIFGNCVILSAIPTTQGLYGFASFYLISGFLTEGITMLQSVAILCSGLAVAAVCLFTALKQAEICTTGIIAMGNGHKVFGNTLIIAVFPELYAILGVALVFLVSGMIGEPVVLSAELVEEGVTNSIEFFDGLIEFIKGVANSAEGLADTAVSVVQ